MKKAYEAPKVEKMTFDYSDSVVASQTQCTDVVVKTFVTTGGKLCEDTTVSGSSNSVGI